MDTLFLYAGALHYFDVKIGQNWEMHAGKRWEVINSVWDAYLHHAGKRCPGVTLYFFVWQMPAEDRAINSFRVEGEIDDANENTGT